MCTVLLLVLFCFLLYARHVRMEVALFVVHVVSLLLFGLKEKSNSVFNQPTLVFPGCALLWMG